MTSRDGRGASLVGQRVLVTGAGGFLGQHLCPRLLAAGAEVHAVSRAHRVATADRLYWWRADVADRQTARALVADVKPDRICHLAGLVDGAPEIGLVEATFHSLLASTVNLLEAAADAGGPRVLLVGSLEEPTGAAGDETPTSPYGAAKWAASAYGRMFHGLFGLPVVIARTHMTYGPGQPEWKLIPSTIRSLLRGERPRVSSGRRELDWVYVDDVADGLLLAASAPGIDGQTVDLGSGALTSVRDLVLELAARVAPGVEPIFNAMPERPPRDARAADVARTRAALGWAPTIALPEGLSRTVSWHRRGDIMRGQVPA